MTEIPEIQEPAPAPKARCTCRTSRMAGLGVAIFLTALAVFITWRFRPTDAPEPKGKLVYTDRFDRAEVGLDYQLAAPDQGYEAGTWTIVDGRLKAERIHNAALWLKKPLPEQVRVEFDARAESETGDVKCEIFGDGKTHQSGYILINGGWNNTVNCIARQDEHGEDRKQDNRCPMRGQRAMCVEPGVDYHWTVIRTDHIVRWYIDGKLFLTFDDRDPVKGKHFAFNNWEAPATFDNLEIYDLSE